MTSFTTQGEGGWLDSFVMVWAYFFNYLAKWLIIWAGKKICQRETTTFATCEATLSGVAGR